MKPHASRASESSHPSPGLPSGQPVGHVIVGGGPAGLAPLLAASRSGRLQALLAAGLVVVDQQAGIGFGNIGRYVINSDSSAETFLSCLVGNPEPRLAALIDHPTARAMSLYGRGAVPLYLVANLMELVGEVLTAIIGAHPGCRVMTRHAAISTRQTADGGWETRLRCLSSGAETVLASRSVLLATGGWQPVPLLDDKIVAGVPLLSTYADRLVQSDQVLSAQGRAAIARRLSAHADPRIVVVGGSTSAMSCARVLMEIVSEQNGRTPVTVLHRRPMSVFYASVEQAGADGYDDFTDEDICPVSGFVHRFGGLRFDSRTLLMGLLGLGGRPADPRVRLQRLGDEASDRALLDSATLIVAALGYRPRALPVLDVNGQALSLNADRPDGALVGEGCGVLDSWGDEIPGLFGIGLAAGYRPGGRLGGEPSFKGQVNGLWVWQNDVGALIADRMTETEANYRVSRIMSGGVTAPEARGADRASGRARGRRDLWSAA